MRLRRRCRSIKAYQCSYRTETRQCFIPSHHLYVLKHINVRIELKPEVGHTVVRLFNRVLKHINVRIELKLSLLSL